MSRVGVYPGSFNPPTIAHLAITEAAVEQRSLDRVVWMLSHRPLAKEHVEEPPFDERLAVLGAIADALPWLSVATTEHQLLVDIADGFDVLVMGADKWHQVNDPVWYGNDTAARDDALARLPELAVAPRPPFEVPASIRLDVDEEHHHVSSTHARDGALHLMAPAARAHAEQTGTWLP